MPTTTQPSEHSDPLSPLAEKLAGGADLSAAEAAGAAAALADPAPEPGAKEAFLRALSAKGETPEEVSSFAKVFRDLSLPTGLDDLAPDAIDIVGTGGDRSGTFNFSTATALLLASIGVPVMKHGNRSITSRSGSADLLAALGVRMDHGPALLRESLERFNFCFFFAPAFHPAFKEIMPVRKRLAESGARTIFNLLGPLINPGRPAHQLMGVFGRGWVAPIADALDRLGLRAALVVHSETGPDSGVDELTVAGANRARGAGALRGFDFPADPGSLGLARARLADLLGGGPGENRIILRSLAEGTAGAPMRDTLCLNAGAALFTCGRVESVGAGIETARQAIRDRVFHDWLARFETFNGENS
ncbi:MAG: anthranilate phosphoribosyltransferase [Puniceicoccaceae bacterium]